MYQENLRKLPQGVVDTVENLLPRFQFVKNNTLRRNICYSVESLQFYEWILKSYEIYGPIKSYLIKTCVIVANSVVEAMTKEFIQQKGVKPNKKHSRNISKLKSLDVSDGLIDSIDKLRLRRSNIHLDLVMDLENDKYKEKDLRSSLECLHNSKSEYTKLLS